MPTSTLPGLVITTPDAADVAEEAAKRLGDAIRESIAQRARATLALSGGNTPRPAYEKLAKQPGIDWAKVHVFWIDERAVPPTHERSNYRLVKESLLERVSIPEANVHRMRGESADLATAADEYSSLLVANLASANGVPVFDVAVLGIGDDGHTASLFPGGTCVDVRDRFVVSVAAAPELEREARISVTTPVLQQIRVPLVLVAGKAKKGPLQRVAAATGALHETPSRLYREAKGALVWVMDAAAAG
jgi:6-phosphogluconolactonase